MINLSSAIVFTDVVNLSAQVHLAISHVLASLVKSNGEEPVSINWNGKHGFQFVFGPRNIPKATHFDQRFVLSAFEFSQMSSRNEYSRQFFDVMKEYGNGTAPPAHGIAYVKKGVKMLLVQLWEQGAIILPTTFETGPHFVSAVDGNELMKFTQMFEVDNKGKQINDNNLNDKEARRIFYYMPRIIRATDWKRVEDFDLYKFSEMHAKQLECIKNASDSFTTAIGVPWTIFTNVLHEYFPDRVRYTLDDIKTYSSWSLSKGAAHEIGLSHYQKRKVDVPKKREYRSDQSGRGVPASVNLKNQLLTLGKSELHDDVLRYFEMFIAGTSERRYFDEIGMLPYYQGREHIDLSILSAQWLKAIRSYRNYRQNIKGYESDSADSSLALLCDYLFLYLPWWKEIHPDSVISLPLSPKDFKRFIFVQRDLEQPISRLPVGLIELIFSRRKGKSTQYSAIIDLELFFAYVQQYYGEDEDMAGMQFRNPIQREFDAPRISRPGKTTKVVFAKVANRYLTKYAYAVEAMGEFLQDECMAGRIYYASAKKMSSLENISCADVGYIPYIVVGKKTIPIFVVPNVFVWNTRTFRSSDGNQDRFVPHLTEHRALTLAVETGLRLAGIRWLDRRIWNNQNSEYPLSPEYRAVPNGHSYVYSLFVNTDKTKEEPFITQIVYRPHAMLRREQKFQESIDEVLVDKEVNYMGRENSRFAPVVPLFRSASSENPISANYRKTWVSLLSGFEIFFQSETGKKTKFVEEVVEYHENGGSKTTLYAINTPHACRATFATNREGFFEIEEIASQLGHSNIETTRVYQSPDISDLRTKLEHSDRIMQGEFERFDKESIVHIHADREDSALVRSFRADQSTTMAQFSFMPPITAWNLSDTTRMSAEKIAALRNGPMSLMRFFPTHICPVGGQCPDEVVKSTGQTGRCGQCPLAMKCIDHLTAISAKKNTLYGTIKYNMAHMEALRASGEISAADDLYDQIEADANELIAWQFSEEVLLKLLKDREAPVSPGEHVVFLVDQPEMVRRHLECITKPSKPMEFVLERIADGNAYPFAQTPELRATAALLRKRILAGNSIDNFLSDLGDFTAVAEVAGMLKSVMRTHGLSIEDVGQKLLQADSYSRTSMLLGEN